MKLPTHFVSNFQVEEMIKNAMYMENVFTTFLVLNIYSSHCIHSYHLYTLSVAMKDNALESHMWQSRVEIEHSVAYFARITTFAH